MSRLAALIAALMLATPAGAEVLLTAHPAAGALANALTAGTEIRVTGVQPDRLPASRLASYLHGRGAGALAEAAQGADAVLSFGAFWPGDPLYPAARRSNIRIVEIDAGRPLDQRMPGIALLEPDRGDAAVYARLGLEPMPPAGEETAPWLSPSRLGEMAEIVAGDLSRLAPDDAAVIATNLAQLKRQLLVLRAGADQALAGAEGEEGGMIAVSPQFGYLAADLGLDLRARIIAAPREWTPGRAAQLTEWMREAGITTVLSARDLPAPLGDALATAGARVLVLETLPDADPVAVIAANIAVLTGGTR